MLMTEPQRRAAGPPPAPQVVAGLADPRPRPARSAAQAEPGRPFTTYYAVRLDPGTLWDPAKGVREQAFWDEHARYMDALFERGAIVLGGPYADRTGSMVVVRARDLRHALGMFQDDPWTVHDVLVAGEVKAWTIFLDDREPPGDPAPSHRNSPQGARPWS